MNDQQAQTTLKPAFLRWRGRGRNKNVLRLFAGAAGQGKELYRWPAGGSCYESEEARMYVESWAKWNGYTIVGSDLD
jgi:hypothetical protein